jgi:hypothetical protein
MRAITVEAKNLDSARLLHAALSRFHPELLGSDDEGYRVSVELRNNDRDIVPVLDAIERYVSERASDPARIELDGRQYTMHATVLQSSGAG